VRHIKDCTPSKNAALGRPSRVFGRQPLRQHPARKGAGAQHSVRHAYSPRAGSAAPGSAARCTKAGLEQQLSICASRRRASCAAAAAEQWAKGGIHFRTSFRCPADDAQGTTAVLPHAQAASSGPLTVSMCSNRVVNTGAAGSALLAAGACADGELAAGGSLPLAPTARGAAAVTACSRGHAPKLRWVARRSGGRMSSSTCPAASPVADGGGSKFPSRPAATKRRGVPLMPFLISLTATCSECGAATRRLVLEPCAFACMGSGRAIGQSASLSRLLVEQPRQQEGAGACWPAAVWLRKTFAKSMHFERSAAAPMRSAAALHRLAARLGQRPLPVRTWAPASGAARVRRSLTGRHALLLVRGARCVR